MNKIWKNYLYNISYQMLLFIIPFITTPYLSRTLGSEKIGIYSYNYSIAQYFILFIMLGLSNYGNRTIAATRNDKNNMSKEFVGIYAFQVFCGLIVSLLYFIYVFFIAKNKTIALIFYINVFGAIFDINWLFFGLEKFKVTVIRNALIKIVSTIFIFILVKQKSDIYIYCFILSLSFLVSQLYLWLFVKKEICFSKPTLSEITKHIKPNLALFITVLLVSMFKIMDKIMLGLLSDYNEVGYYESSEKIIAIPVALITALGTVMLPRTTNLIAIGDENNAQKYISKSINFAMFVSSSMCFGIMGISKTFIPVFYGEGFTKCVGLYLTILPSCLFLAFANVIRTQYLLPKKLDRSYMISAGLGALVNIVANAILIPVIGSLGAAIGTLLAEAVVCIYQVNSVKKYLPISTYICNTLPMVGAGVLMFIILFLINIPINNGVFEILLKCVIGATIYFSILIFYYWLFYNVTKKQWIDLSGISSIAKRTLKDKR